MKQTKQKSEVLEATGSWSRRMMDVHENVKVWNNMDSVRNHGKNQVQIQEMDMESPYEHHTSFWGLGNEYRLFPRMLSSCHLMIKKNGSW